MKRRPFALSGIFLLIIQTAQAQYNFTTNNGTITITRYIGADGAVTIPDTITGLPVTSIGEHAFSFTLGALTTILIPASVTNIAHTAFNYCLSPMSITVDAANSAYSSLNGVLFDKSEKTLIQVPMNKAGNYAIPGTVISIGGSAFGGCANLTSVKIPDSVTSIEDNAFVGCGSLTNVTIGHGVTSIGVQVFNSLTSLSRVIIPENITNIGQGAFSFCGLTSVTIPDRVESIGSEAFLGCGSLTNIAVDPRNPTYRSQDGVLFDKDELTLIQFPGGKAGSYSIPNSVTGIGARAFYYCSNLTNITIGSGLVSIEYGSFIDCTSLTGLYFKGNAPSIDVDVFIGDNNATVYYLPGTTGWGSTIAGRPTALWQPRVQTDNGSFGVRTNQFGFNINWTRGQMVVVEACTNLNKPLWSSVRTSTLVGDSVVFSDPQWTNYRSRFYRLRSP